MYYLSNLNGNINDNATNYFLMYAPTLFVVLTLQRMALIWLISGIILNLLPSSVDLFLQLKFVGEEDLLPTNIKSQCSHLGGYGITISQNNIFPEFIRIAYLQRKQNNLFYHKTYGFNIETNFAPLYTSVSFWHNQATLFHSKKSVNMKINFLV